VFFFPFGGGMFAMLVQEGFFWCSIIGAPVGSNQDCATKDVTMLCGFVGSL
jgi:hypothetical protein